MRSKDLTLTSIFDIAGLKQVARQLTGRNFDVQLYGGGACVDMKNSVIYLPHTASEIMSDKDIKAQQTLVRFLIDHECGHPAGDAPDTGKQDVCNQHGHSVAECYNALLDIRDEWNLSQKFVGCRRNLMESDAMERMTAMMEKKGPHSLEYQVNAGLIMKFHNIDHRRIVRNVMAMRIVTQYEWMIDKAKVSTFGQLVDMAVQLAKEIEDGNQQIREARQREQQREREREQRRQQQEQEQEDSDRGCEGEPSEDDGDDEQVETETTDEPGDADVPEPKDDDDDNSAEESDGSSGSDGEDGEGKSDDGDESESGGGAGEDDAGECEDDGDDTRESAGDEDGDNDQSAGAGGDGDSDDGDSDTGDTDEGADAGDGEGDDGAAEDAGNDSAGDGAGSSSGPAGADNEGDDEEGESQGSQGTPQETEDRQITKDISVDSWRNKSFDLAKEIQSATGDNGYGAVESRSPIRVGDFALCGGIELTNVASASAIECQRLAESIANKDTVHVQVAQNGIVNKSRMIRANCGDPRVMLRRRLEAGRKTGIVISIDASSSMCSPPKYRSPQPIGRRRRRRQVETKAKIVLAAESASNLVRVLTKIPGTSCAVHAWTSTSMRDPVANDDTHQAVIGITRVAKPDDPLKTKLERIARLSGVGGTPEKEGMFMAGYEASMMDAHRKIVVFISDGQFNFEGCAEAVKFWADRGVETAVVFIDCQVNQQHAETLLKCPVVTTTAGEAIVAGLAKVLNPNRKVKVK